MSTPDNSQIPPTPPEGATEGSQVQDAAPAADAPVFSPTMPAAGSNRMPQLAGVNSKPYVAPKPAGHRRSKFYGIGAAIFVVVSVAGYFGFRSYIYGEDAPPIPVLDDIGD